MKLTYLLLSAHPARSTPRPDLCLRPERSAFALARSIWSNPITLNSLTRGGMDSRVRRFLLGLTNFSLRKEWPRPAGQAFLTEMSQSCRGVRIRLDFCRKGRIAMCVGRWIWLPAGALRA